MNPVNLSSPVNWMNPLNRGAVSWYLTLPHQIGGSSWKDLVSNVDATLTNMEQADWVTSQDRPGGWGALNLDGDPEFITRSPPITVVPFTFSAWVLGDSNSALMKIAQLGNTVPASKFYGIAMDANANFTAEHFDGTSPFKFAASTTELVVGRWYHVCGIFPSNISRSIFVDGKFEATNGGSNFASDVFNYTFGRQDPGTTHYWNGRIDDVRLWNRALTNTEVRELYQDSKQGYPGTLRRLNRRAFFPVEEESVSSASTVSSSTSTSSTSTAALSTSSISTLALSTSSTSTEALSTSSTSTSSASSSSTSSASSSSSSSTQAESTSSQSASSASTEFVAPPPVQPTGGALGGRRELSEAERRLIREIDQLQINKKRDVESLALLANWFMRE